MKKIYGWTMIEMIIALTVLILLSGLCVSVYKPNVQKARIVTYAAIKNLTQGNLAIIEGLEIAKANASKAEEGSETEGSTPEGSGTETEEETAVILPEEEDKVYEGSSNKYDAYCVSLANVFSLEKAPDCISTTEKDKDTKVNLTFPTGVTVQGLTNGWKTPYEGAGYKFKNIVIDIDGSKGVNKVGVDRFPLRVYNGGSYTGNILVVNCKNDVIYNDKSEKIVLSESEGKSPYCKHGFLSNGASSTNALALSNKVISYDIFRAKENKEQTEAVMIASNLAPMEADCGAYGGDGFYNKKECVDANNKINNQKLAIKSHCATISLCSSCSANGVDVCPKNKDNNGYTNTSSCSNMAKDINPGDMACFTILHKPSGGTTFLLETLIGQFDM